MIVIVQRHSLRVAAVVYAALLLPPVRHALEASMTAQMLVQIPLLIAVGYLLCGAVPQRSARTIER